MNHTTAWARTAVVALASTAVLLPAAAAHANDDDVVKRGSCSGRTDWKVKASPENGRIEVEGEIDSGRKGQRWHWRIVHNGSVSYKGVKETSGASGSFEVRRTIVNARGDDRIVFKAVNRRSDEVCRGRLTY